MNASLNTIFVKINPLNIPTPTLATIITVTVELSGQGNAHSPLANNQYIPAHTFTAKNAIIVNAVSLSILFIIFGDTICNTPQGFKQPISFLFNGF